MIVRASVRGPARQGHHGALGPRPLVMFIVNHTAILSALKSYCPSVLVPPIVHHLSSSRPSAHFRDPEPCVSRLTSLSLAQKIIDRMALCACVTLSWQDPGVDTGRQQHYFSRIRDQVAKRPRRQVRTCTRTLLCDRLFQFNYFFESRIPTVADSRVFERHGKGNARGDRSRYV